MPSKMRGWGKCELVDKEIFWMAFNRRDT